MQADGVGSPPFGSEAGSPRKLRRTSKACVQCRLRKQKCDGQSKVDSRRPCRRCVYLGASCSFAATTSAESDAEVVKQEKTARHIARLERLVKDQGERLHRLEVLIGDFQKHSPSPNADTIHVSGLKSYGRASALANDNGVASSVVSESPTCSNSSVVRSRGALDVINLDTPMSTLRHLKEHDKPPGFRPSIQDPISCGLISSEEAQEAFDLFFTHCHRWAPVLCPLTQRVAEHIRISCPTLFIAVCCVGLRFRKGTNQEVYRQLVGILDASLSRLLLRPSQTDVHLDHIRVFLLYIQWMPVDILEDDELATRYNDVSAWSMLGLAIRYALFLGLHQDAVESFAAKGNVEHLRVWINLLTCDANLMLSSGLPASLNPEPVAAVARSFSSSSMSSQPDDTRAAALCELVAILKRAAKSSGKPNVRALDSFTLRQTNAEFDAWESSWSYVLSEAIQHNQMPFTTLRAYRLAINSACLSSLLSPSRESSQLSLHVLQALEVALGAATQTIFALSAQSSWKTWLGQTTSIAYLPTGPLVIDSEAVKSLSYSVDSSWINHSFAAIFLVFCFARGVVDDDLRILALAGSDVGMTYPARPRAESLLCRLISLAAQIFETIGTEHSKSHPAAEYQALLTSVFSVIVGDEEVVMSNDQTNRHDGFEEDLKQLFDSMVNNTDLNWDLPWS